MSWAHPGALVLLVLAVLPWLWARRRPRAGWASAVQFGPLPRTLKERLSGLPTLARTAGIACLVVALAGPRVVGGKTRITTQGVAILAAIDRSSSMNAVDPEPAETGRPPSSVERSRLVAARETLQSFLEGRPDDLIGLLGFANFPDLLCPPTLDRDFLKESIASLKSARPGEDGTNLGDAIIWSIDALQEAPARRKVLILLTDGRNDPAVPKPADPREAASLAKTFGITLHTIAVGRPGGQLRMPESRTGLPLVREVEGPDLELLKELADRGGGQAFRAGNPGDLAEVFKLIDQLEPTSIQGEVRLRYEGRHLPWLLGAVGCLSLDLILGAGLFRRLP